MLDVNERKVIINDILELIFEYDLSPSDTDCNLCKDILENKYFDLDDRIELYDLNSLNFKEVYYACIRANQLLRGF